MQTYPREVTDTINDRDRSIEQDAEWDEEEMAEERESFSDMMADREVYNVHAN